MPNKNFPIVAIVGEPNVGKSTLLNKITGKPLAVTSDIAGTTRDRQYLDTSWSGVTFTLVDTAGLTLGSREELELSLQKQIEVALKEADLVILVVDGKQPKSSVNVNVLKKSRKTKKLLVLCVNKLDSPKTAEEKLIEFSALGIKPMFGISSVSGRGIGDMLDSITHTLSLSPSPIHGVGAGGEVDDDNKDDEKSIAVAIVGKPNVGKSSIFNSLVKEERVVVSP